MRPIALFLDFLEFNYSSSFFFLVTKSEIATAAAMTIANALDVSSVWSSVFALLDPRTAAPFAAVPSLVAPSTAAAGAAATGAGVTGVGAAGVGSSPPAGVGSSPPVGVGVGAGFADITV